MLPDDTRRKIENITQGIIIEGVLDNCASVRNLLSGRYPTSRTVKTNFEGQSVIKKEQAQLIEEYCNQHNLWVANLPGEDRYLTRGGEASVYLLHDGLTVIKLNDGVYYATCAQADMGDIKKLLEYNGFINTRRQDYKHPELGLILEDMHDENVLVYQQKLFFIDTVFYTVTPETMG